jgi:hypothetical protein
MLHNLPFCAFSSKSSKPPRSFPNEIGLDDLVGFDGLVDLGQGVSCEITPVSFPNTRLKICLSPMFTDLKRFFPGIQPALYVLEKY